MGFISKLFGKKDELDLDEKPIYDESELDLGEKPVIPETPTGLPSHLEEPSGTPIQPAAPTPSAISPRDIELINSKLDTLKAILNSLDQRIANLEKAAGVEHKKMPW